MRLRTPHGHLLAEALVAAAVLLIALTGFAGALLRAASDVDVSNDSQDAVRVAQARLEALRARPAATWVVGATGPEQVPGRPASWTTTTTITSAADPDVPGVTLKRASVRVDYRQDRSVTLEAVAW